jgi:peroxin-6
VQTPELSIPPQWLNAYDHIFSQRPIPASLAVVAIQPVLLTEVIVTALSTDSYRAAWSHELLLESWLSKDSPILRQGAIHSFNADLLPTNGRNSHGKQFHYRIEMVEPVLQGYARLGETKFVVTLPETGPDLPARGCTELGGELDCQDVFEINENFLASSVLTSSSTPSSFALCGTLPSPHGHSNEISVADSHLESVFRVVPLTEGILPVGDDCTLYLRTSDLGKVGALNCDWVSSWFRRRSVC